ncbi:nuclear transport factor 2-like [Orycteropus afer afer]|uniref:Nuclear transport factor 2-like n=1 Tax=Orycteropus afer afer TaxID=1230840 RepID=A0AC54ZAD9_ORYAF|nr:nuclear transport factor 2-like [Orycteropus afer afer]
MAESPMWEHIGTSFVHLYYHHFDADRAQLSTLYSDASRLSWEGEQLQGKAAIMGKLMNIPFHKVQRFITSQDHQPAPDNRILSMVVGKVKVNGEPLMEFHQAFVLKNMNDKWICTNDIFRVALPHFG